MIHLFIIWTQVIFVFFLCGFADDKRVSSVLFTAPRFHTFGYLTPRLITISPRRLHHWLLPLDGYLARFVTLSTSFIFFWKTMKERVDRLRFGDRGSRKDIIVSYEGEEDRGKQSTGSAEWKLGTWCFTLRSSLESYVVTFCIVYRYLGRCSTCHSTLLVVWVWVWSSGLVKNYLVLWICRCVFFIEVYHFPL